MKASILATLLATPLFSVAAAAQTYTLTELGPRCGADLRAQLVQTQQGPAVRFRLHSRLENSLAVLVIGSRAPTPTPLPAGPCQLFVHQRATMLGMTNGNGNEHFGFRIPPVLPIRVAFQAVVVDFSPPGFHVASSDVIRLRGQ